MNSHPTRDDAGTPFSDSPTREARDPVAGSAYQARSRPASAPDLDASVPVLKAADLQRLNRKALLFLAGIVVLLTVVSVWLLRSAMADDGESSKVSEEEVRVPDAPRASAPDLPPLPDDPPPAAMENTAALPLEPTYPVAAGAAASIETLPSSPSLLERRIADDGGHAPVATGLPGMVPPEAYAQQMLGLARGPQDDTPPSPQVAMAQPIRNPDTLLARGTYLRCIMETRIVTDVPGFTSCVVTEPVYSINGNRLLLPRGSRVSGTYANENASVTRVAVVWERIVTPDGIDIRMSSPGVDALGAAGHPGDHDAHWGSRIASALLISLVSDAFKYAGAKHGPEATTVTNAGNEFSHPYESNTARAMERLAHQALEQGASRRPTVTIHQGALVNIYVARDVDFSPVLR